LLLHFGKKKTCKRVKFMHDAWFDIHDICLIPPKKNIWQTSFPFDFLQPFFRRHPIHPGRRQNPPFEIQAVDAPRDTWEQPNGLGSVGWWEDHVGHVGIPHWVGRSLFRGETLLWNFLRGVKTRGFCLRGTFFSSPWNYLKKKVLQRNWFVNFFGCWWHTPNCIVMWWTKRSLIFLASNYLRKTWVFQWWPTLLPGLHTSDVGVHVLPHLPSLEALRCPPWHLQIQVYLLPTNPERGL